MTEYPSPNRRPVGVAITGYARPARSNATAAGTDAKARAQPEPIRRRAASLGA